MKKLLLSIITATTIFGGIANAQENQTNDKKVLVVYYSKSGNTKQIAQYIQETTGGDIFAIEPLTPYPDDYKATTKQAKEEINQGYLPPINSINNLSKYDVVFVGSPCWWSTIAPPVSTFLSNNDLSGKIIVPFSTHGGSGLANNATDTAKLTPNSKVLDGKAFRGGDTKSAKEEVTTWINELKL